MMVETVVDVTSTHNTAQIANVLILMEVGMEQHALNQQLVQQLHQFQLQQELLSLQFLDPLVIKLKSFYTKDYKVPSFMGERTKKLLKLYQTIKIMVGSS